MSGSASNGFAMDTAGQSSRSGGIPFSSRRPMKRPAAFHEEDEDEDDGFQKFQINGNSSRAERGPSSRDEMLTGYSIRGAEKVKRSPPKQGPRIIAKQADLNWMEERKRRLGLEKYRDEMGRLTSMRMPGGNDSAVLQNTGWQDVEMEGMKDRIGDGNQLSGLQIQQKKKSREEEEMEEIERLQEEARTAVNGHNNGDETPITCQAGQSPVLPAQTEAEREDEEARFALLSGQRLGVAIRRQEDRVIPISEEEALRRDTETRPEAPSLSDYAKMPVEEFGAALLRGMGWKEGMGAGKNRQGPTSAPEVKKRAALLGLGAKERVVDEPEDGAKGTNFRVERPDRRYIPVIRKERENGGSSSSSPAPRSSHHRDRSRSPQRRRDDDISHMHRSNRDYSDEEYERRKRREREKERERHRDDDRYRSRSQRDYR